MKSYIIYLNDIRRKILGCGLWLGVFCINYHECDNTPQGLIRMPCKTALCTLWSWSLVQKFKASGSWMYFFLVFVLCLYFTECTLPSTVVFLPANPWDSKEIRFPVFDKEKDQSP